VKPLAMPAARIWPGTSISSTGCSGSRHGGVVITTCPPGRTSAPALAQLDLQVLNCVGQFTRPGMSSGRAQRGQDEIDARGEPGQVRGGQGGGSPIQH
jgi:hypothetical protein